MELGGEELPISPISPLFVVEPVSLTQRISASYYLEGEAIRDIKGKSSFLRSTKAVSGTPVLRVVPSHLNPI